MALISKKSALIGLISGLITLAVPNARNQAANGISYREAPSSQLIAQAEVPTSPRLIESYYADMLATLPIRLRPGSDHRKDSKPTLRSSRRCKSIVYRTLMEVPEIHLNALDELTLFYTPDGRRGLGGNSSIVLRCLNVTDSELASVLLHEIGHIVDANVLTGSEDRTESEFFDFDQPITIDDASLAFYRLSWESDKKQRDDSSELDFVSQYAMTDPFEDFAETYAYYRAHGGDFRFIKGSSNILAEKYNFMKNTVFGGVEFGADIIDTGEALPDPNTRTYDVTILPFSLVSFFQEQL